MNVTNDTNESEKIYIIDLISQLANLGVEKDKDDFIKNYSKLKEQIDKTDLILANKDEQDYNTYDIQELFNVLESNSELISKPEKLDVQTLKLLSKITKILDDKLNIETINIIESK